MVVGEPYSGGVEVIQPVAVSGRFLCAMNIARFAVISFFAAISFSYIHCSFPFVCSYR